MRRILLSHLMFAAGAFTTLAIINSESVRKCPPIQTLKYRLNEVKNKAKNSKFMACKDDLLKKFNDVQETLNNINLNDIGVDVLSAFKDLLKDDIRANIANYKIKNDKMFIGFRKAGNEQENLSVDVDDVFVGWENVSSKDYRKTKVKFDFNNNLYFNR